MKDGLQVGMLILVIALFFASIVFFISRFRVSLPYEQIRIEFENINDIENNKYIKVNNEIYYKE